MNDRDSDNLNFLLSVSPEVLADWYLQADEDDLSYATELLETVNNKLHEMAIENELETSDFLAAKLILLKFTDEL
jgi:hypothetical protein